MICLPRRGLFFFELFYDDPVTYWTFVLLSIDSVLAHQRLHAWATKRKGPLIAIFMVRVFSEDSVIKLHTFGSWVGNGLLIFAILGWNIASAKVATVDYILSGMPNACSLNIRIVAFCCRLKWCRPPCFGVATFVYCWFRAYVWRVLYIKYFFHFVVRS